MAYKSNYKKNGNENFDEKQVGRKMIIDVLYKINNVELLINGF